jgi:hypothetical protein
MLSSLVDQTIADERANCVFALCLVIAALGDDAAAVAGVAAQALRVHLTEDVLPVGAGVGAIWTGVLAKDPEVEAAGFADTTLMADSGSLALLWPLLPRLSEANATAVRKALGSLAAQEDGPLSDALAQLPSEHAVKLVEEAGPAIEAALTASAEEDEDSVEAAAVGLIDATLSRPRPDVARPLNWRLLRWTFPGAYAAVRARSSQVIELLDDKVGRNRHALVALAAAPAADWQMWADLLVAGASPATEERYGRDAVGAVIAGWAAAPPAEQEAAALIVRSVAATGFPVDLPATSVAAGGPLSTLMQPVSWQNNPDLLDRTFRLWAFCDVLAETGAISQEWFSTAVLNDVGRVLAAMQPPIATALTRLVPLLPAAAVETVDGATPDGQAWSIPLRLSVQLRARELDVEVGEVPAAEVQAAVVNRAGEAGQALPLWLRLIPTPEEVLTVWAAQPAVSPALDAAFDTWAETLTESERSELWLDFMDRGVEERWRARLRASGTDDVLLIRGLISRIESEAAAARRAPLAVILAGLEPQGDSGKAVVNLAVELFGKGTKADVDTAARLVLASPRYRVGELRTLFAAADADGRAPNGRLRKELEAQGWLRRTKREKKRRFPLPW